ncbi:MAG: hypothetical protein JNM17_40830 [Archangium sp.]|nr:hypothetical protein [Archangium sp.]
MRSGSWLSLVPLFLGSVVGSSACLSPVVDNLCRNHAECAPGLECVDGTCVPFGTRGGGANGGGANGGGTGGANGGGTGGANGGGTGGANGGGTGGSNGGGGGSGRCDPSNCAGCCSGGACVGGNDDRQCGAFGLACTSCSTNESCVAGKCMPRGGGGGGFGGGAGGGFGGGGGGSACGPTTCRGCCTSSGTCSFGQAANECGFGGNVCVDCGPNAFCSQGFCFGGTGGGGGGVGGGGGTSCGPMTCPGCCTASGVCTSGQNNFACGFGGNSCVSCGSTATCQMGICFAGGGGGGGPIGGGGGGGGTTCVGCINSNGQCRSGTSNLACGAGGNMCVQCPFGTQCSGGQCLMVGCGPMSCNGCCSGGQCIPPSQQNSGQCGFGGQVCTSCFPGSSCQGGFCQSLCDGMTCPNGCCDFNGQCIVNGGPSACGSFGQFCNTCFPGQSCVGGNCVGGFDGGFGGGGGGFGGGAGGGPVGGGPIGGGFGGGTAVGSACSTDSNCQPPFQQVCLPQITATGTTTGYPGGYCTARCTPMMPCTSGVCIHETSSDPGSCKEQCFSPGGGQSSCRTGYVCAVGDTPIPQLIGWCRPRCTNGALAACPSGTTCNMNTGYCQ